MLFDASLRNRHYITGGIFIPTVSNTAWASSRDVSNDQYAALTITPSPHRHYSVDVTALCRVPFSTHHGLSCQLVMLSYFFLQPIRKCVLLKVNGYDRGNNEWGDPDTIRCGSEHGSKGAFVSSIQYNNWPTYYYLDVMRSTWGVDSQLHNFMPSCMASCTEQVGTLRFRTLMEIQCAWTTMIVKYYLTHVSCRRRCIMSNHKKAHGGS